MAGQELLQEDCLQVLRKFLKSDNFELSSFEIVSFRNPLQGLIGEHFTLRVAYVFQDKKGSQDFFVKTLSSNPYMAEFSKSMQVYEKEAFFFGLLEQFERHQIEVSFAPKGFFFKPYITVIEDLSSEFKGTQKRELLDFDHCLTSLEALAKFHASTILYERIKSKELGQKYRLSDDYRDLLEDKLEHNSLALNWLQASIEGLFQLIDVIPENHISHNEFKEKLGEFLELGDPPQGLIQTILHSDLWTSNFLHHYKDGKPVETKLLDFQTIKSGFVEQDVAEFLMTSTSRAFRGKNSKFLIEYYYKKLQECLGPEGLPPSGDFLQSCDNYMLVGKMHAVVDHAFTFVADEIYVDVLKSEESFRKFLFEERGKWIIESYNKDEKFKNMLYEDVLELRDMLFA
ncbi:uncharacterized protein LOC657653 [Tribolium castaneum]|uniref:CHK kinase-like domain-containing protein n=1 Tax=Tribolium castaneum TaxID=7070 RepID=D6WMZ3_TRICA|nr:PREDICTED: uncharacterized protein LOC657653 [Tribolium castaneum]XP_008194252.1 PREDICTED: uncharacterized protein LOC657653 [Tribolium castaneum]XP_015836044.1 PREDICTED: uncharacterized protein LOC657653 [Tribolium castaneum]XP_015836045.1 PREDICTED: uncharacterized protein LOC657653 [Tribolium castaneum]XP_969193.1 PREDICTED: uncharacterized protein LOC657653 [Tribolium castaneum]EFA03261.1 hypothetical protein TcasGA2_TC013195 [Tribolium castaneum]|eukprot:XP_008194250.1 PREDICTED: uncharacterized protein LOC657653 [Tribolium castaneum]